MERLSFQEHNRCELWSAFTLVDWILHLRICKWSLVRFFFHRPDSQFLIRSPGSPPGAHSAMQTSPKRRDTLPMPYDRVLPEKLKMGATANQLRTPSKINLTFRG